MKLFNLSLLCLCFFWVSCMGTSQSTVKASADKNILSIDAQMAYEMVLSNKSNPGFIIIDVRATNDFTNGHIPGSGNLDYDSLFFTPSVNGLDRNKTYLIYCKSGHKSTKAMEIFQKLEFRQVYTIFGGFTEWQEKGFPVAK